MTGGDPLYQPLGLSKGPEPRRRAWVPVTIGLGVLVLAGAGAVALHGRSGGDRDTVAVAPIEPLKPASPAPPAEAPPVPPRAAAAGGVTVEPNGDTVEVQNGVKIIRMGAGRTAAVPPSDAVPVRLAPAPDPALVERTAAGDLPRIGPDGRRPSDVYARPATALAMARAAAPRLALLVGDLGLDPALTRLAGQKLPPAVSLAFRPDGTEPAVAVTQAREAGHEVFLELAGVAPTRSATGDPLDGLHRMMGRFAGYVGVTAEVGGAFPTQPGAGGLVGKELIARGLLLVDNDATPAGGIAAKSSAITPDVIIDGRLAPGSIAAAFTQLEQVARAKGVAMGYLGHPSGDLAAISAALAGSGERGFVLVPVSATAQTAPTPFLQGSR